MEIDAPSIERAFRYLPKSLLRRIRVIPALLESGVLRLYSDRALDPEQLEELLCALAETPDLQRVEPGPALTKQMARPHARSTTACA